MTRRVLVSHRLPELRSGNAELDRWVAEHLQRHVAEVFEQIAFLTPETGSWTPAVIGSGTAGTYELATASGVYYKIADLVVFDFGIVFAAAVTGGGTGNLQITGAPFEKPEKSGLSYFPMGTVFTDGVDLAANTMNLVCTFAAENSSTLLIEQIIDNAAVTPLPISAVAVNDRIYGTIVVQAGDRSA